MTDNKKDPGVRVPQVLSEKRGEEITKQLNLLAGMGNKPEDILHADAVALFQLMHANAVELIQHIWYLEDVIDALAPSQVIQ